jgi:hypothetical protein
MVKNDRRSKHYTLERHSKAQGSYSRTKIRTMTYEVGIIWKPGIGILHSLFFGFQYEKG